jgi:hypothetical protein
VYARGPSAHLVDGTIEQNEIYHVRGSGWSIRVRGEIMGSQKCRIVGKSQSVLIMINPIISTRTRWVPLRRARLSGGRTWITYVCVCGVTPRKLALLILMGPWVPPMHR